MSDFATINPFAPLPPPVPLEPLPPPPPPRGKLSTKTMQGIQASFTAPDPQAQKPGTPPAPPKGTAQGMQLKPGWGGGR